jgi:hypothetical protein
LRDRELIAPTLPEWVRTARQPGVITVWRRARSPFDGRHQPHEYDQPDRCGEEGGDQGHVHVSNVGSVCLRRRYAQQRTASASGREIGRASTVAVSAIGARTQIVVHGLD